MRFTSRLLTLLLCCVFEWRGANSEHSKEQTFSDLSNECYNWSSRNCMVDGSLRECNCDEECYKFGDCCQDKFNSIQNLPSEQFDCIEIISNNQVSDSILAIASCPTNRSSSVKYSIERTHLNAHLWLLPAIDSTTHKVYKNIDYAECNSVPFDNLVKLNAEIICTRPIVWSQFKAGAIYVEKLNQWKVFHEKKLTENLNATDSIKSDSESVVKCTFTLSVFSLGTFLEQNKFRHCAGYMRRKCSNESLGTDFDRQLCGKFNQPVYVFDETQDGWWSFVNPHCARCNGYNQSLVCHPTEDHKSRLLLDIVKQQKEFRFQNESLGYNWYPILAETESEEANQNFISTPQRHIFSSYSIENETEPPFFIPNPNDTTLPQECSNSSLRSCVTSDERSQTTQCHCDRHCHKYGDCCDVKFNLLYKNEWSSMTHKQTEQYDCIMIISKNLILESILGIATCPTEDHSIKQYPLKRTQLNAHLWHLPAIDSVTHKIYKNFLYAECNAVPFENLVKINTEIACDRPITSDQFKAGARYQEKSNGWLTECRWIVFEEPNLVEKLRSFDENGIIFGLDDSLVKCTYSLLDFRNEPFQSEHSFRWCNFLLERKCSNDTALGSDEDRKLCGKYNQPVYYFVYDDDQQGGAWRGFINSHCARCHGYNHSLVCDTWRYNVPMRGNRYHEVAFKPAKPDFTVLVDMNENLNETHHYPTYIRQVILTQICLGVSFIGIVLHLVFGCLEYGKSRAKPLNANFPSRPRKLTLPIYLTTSMCVTLLCANASFLVCFYVTEIPFLCTHLPIITIYFFLSSFIWMFTIALDLYLSLRNMDKKRLVWKTKEWIAYSLWGWIVPAIFAGSGLTIQLLNGTNSTSMFNPQFGRDKLCWITNPTARIVYFIGPSTFIVGLNLILFVKLILIFRHLKRNAQDAFPLDELQTSNSENKPEKLSTRSASTSSSQSSSAAARITLALYFRIVAILGVTWILYLVAYLANLDLLWDVWIVLSSLQGLAIFFAYNGSTLRAIFSKNV